MKKIFFISLIILFTVNSFAQKDSILSEGIERTYIVHIPPSYNDTTPYPLVLAFHGGMGNAANLQYQSKLNLKANSAHFIVAYPEGVKNPDSACITYDGCRTWNAGNCCGYAMNNNIDDVGFVDELLDMLIKKYNIDTTRIYTTGISNGGMFCYRLACELSDRFAAVAPVAATMLVTNGCSPQRIVPIIHFHSYLDTRVPLHGGHGDGLSKQYCPPVDSVLNAWAGYNNCTNLNDTVYDGADYDFLKWHPCYCNSEIQQYITHDGGHSWPSGTVTGSGSGDSVSYAVNANDLMWSFFEQYTLNCDGVSVNDFIKPVLTEINIYPNPTTQFVNIEFNLYRKEYVLMKLFDISGNEIKTITNSAFEKGKHTISFSSGFLPAGVCYVKLQTGSSVQTIKIEMVK